MIVLWILLGIIAFVLVLAAIMPARYRVQQATLIARPPAAVFANISNLNRYRDWNPWQKGDPTSQQVVTGEAGTIGHRYAWDGKKVGVGSLTLRKATPDSTVEFDLEFIKPWKAHADDVWTLSPEGAGTRVTWTNEGTLPYPMGRLFGPLIKSGLSKQFAEGLANLKQLTET